MSAALAQVLRPLAALWVLAAFLLWGPGEVDALTAAWRAVWVVGGFAFAALIYAVIHRGEDTTEDDA